MPIASLILTVRRAIRAKLVWALLASFAVAPGALASPYGDALNALNRRQYEDAAQFFGLAIASNLQPEESLWYRAEIRALQRRPAEAFADCDRLKQLTPKNPGSLLARARVAELLGDDAGVERHLRAAIAQFPASAQAYNSLAWRLATNPSPGLRNGREAVRLAQRACALTGNESWSYLDTLASAYAEAGNWPEAIRLQREAIEGIKRKISTGPPGKTLEAMNQRLREFQRSRPYRHVPEREVLIS